MLPAAAATTCTLTPQLRSVTINQGLGSYQPLVRGKETLVRLYLNLPSCAANKDFITLNGGSLNVSVAGATTAQGIPPTPAPVSPFPQMATNGAAPSIDSPGDPKFVVAGSALQPATLGTFSATFTATISYSADGGPVSSVTFTNMPGTTTPISANFAQKTNALRVLVVPMGDAGQTASTQFTSSAQSEVQRGMLQLSRIFPVSAGTGDLTSSTGGLRYTINAGMLNIGPTGLSLMTGSPLKFCGNSANFNAIQGQLATFLQAWNAANPNYPADRVLGAIDQTISLGSGSGCAEGMAAVGNTEAWVRAIYGGTTPSTTGGVMGMELAHTMGLVPKSRYDPYSLWHSPNTTADSSPTQLANRTYNVMQRTYISDNHTVMDFTGTYTEVNTLLEQPDYQCLLYLFGGTAPTGIDCGTGTIVGTANGVGANPTFVLSGTCPTAGSSPACTGANVVDSYFAQGVARTTPQPTSQYRLLYRQGTTVLAGGDFGVPVSFITDEHGVNEPNPPVVGLFSVAYPFNLAATSIELWNGEPTAGGTRLYAATMNCPAGTIPPCLPAPTVSSTPPGGAGSASFYTSQARNPALSPDGNWVAWSGSQGAIEVAPVSDATKAVTLLTDGSPVPSIEPAWRRDGGAIAFVNTIDGLLYSTAFSVSAAGIPQFGSPSAFTTSDTCTKCLDHPTFSPDGTAIAFENTQTRVIEGLFQPPGAEFPTELALTSVGTGVTDSGPSWSPTLSGGGSQIAYTESSINIDFPTSKILRIDPSTATANQVPTPQPIVSNATDPSWGNAGLIAYVGEIRQLLNLNPNGIYTVHPDGTGATQLTTNPSDATPSLSGGTIAFQQADRIGDATTLDIWLIGATNFANATTTITQTIDDPATLRADVFYGCPNGTNYPVAVGQPPSSTSGTTATFLTNFNPGLACAGGSVYAKVNDGFQQSGAGTAQPLNLASKAPIVSISSPQASDCSRLHGCNLLQFDNIPLAGAAKDAQDGQLPCTTTSSCSALAWSLSGPSGSGVTRSGTGGTVDLSAPAGGWPVGSYTATLSVTDSAGNSGQAQVTFPIDANATDTGIPDSVSTSADCQALGYSTINPLPPYGLSVNGIPNIDDPTPCTLKTTPYGALILSFPQTIYEQSTATTFATGIAVPYRDIRQVSGNSVKITAISGHTVNGGSGFPNTGWFISIFQGIPHCNGGGLALFNLQTLISYLKSAGISSGAVTITIIGTGTDSSGHTWSFQAVTSAIVNPGAPPGQ